MLRELSIRKLNDVVFIEVKAKRYEDNYKELCLMIDYIIKNSYAKLESFDIDEKFEACFSSNKLEEIIKKVGISNITDTLALEEIVLNVISNNPDSVSDYKAGKDRAIKYLMGQIMKETKGSANPKLVNEILTRELNK